MPLIPTITKIGVRKENGVFIITLNLKVNDGTSDVLDNNFSEIYSKRNSDTVVNVQERFRQQMQAFIDDYKSGTTQPSNADLLTTITKLKNSLIL